MKPHPPVTFADNAAARARPDSFIAVTVECAAVLKSWKASLYSFEWLRPDGTIKSLEDLSGPEAAKRLAVESALVKGEPIEKPVLGIGILDNIEIGSGRAQFLTLVDLGHTTLPVHIPASNTKDFKAFLAKGSVG
jgi:hypothetical protein